MPNEDQTNCVLLRLPNGDMVHPSGVTLEEMEELSRPEPEEELCPAGFIRW